MNKKPVILSQRMQQIVEQIKPCSVLADIGCDHGKICYQVLHLGLAQFVFGSDISAKSVEKTQKLLSNWHFENFKTLVSDGLNNFTTNEKKLIQTLVIAGIGGHEMIQILTAMLDKMSQFPNLNQLVLQPQNNVILLRRFLNEHRLAVVFDSIIWESPKYYNILSVFVQKKRKPLTEPQILWGKTNLTAYHEPFEHYLTDELKKINAILLNINPNKRKDFVQKQKQLQKRLCVQQKMKTKKLLSN